MYIGKASSGCSTLQNQNTVGLIHGVTIPWTLGKAAMHPSRIQDISTPLAHTTFQVGLTCYVFFSKANENWISRLVQITGLSNIGNCDMYIHCFYPVPAPKLKRDSVIAYCTPINIQACKINTQTDQK